MPFTIRVDYTMKEKIDPKALRHAFRKALGRYPYFSVSVVRRGEELVTVPNSRPPVVYKGPKLRPLNSESVNGHLLAICYLDREISFLTSHVITDGAGFYPFIKTCLYEYLCEVTGTQLDPRGIVMCGDPFFADELGNPYPEAQLETASPFYAPPSGSYLRLSSDAPLPDEQRCVYRLILDEAEVMRFNHDNDASPCALISSLMARAIRAVHPDDTRDVVGAISFNQRPALGNRHSYRMLCSALMLRYPYKAKDYEVSRLCTCTRGMIYLQSLPENALASCRRQKDFLGELIALPSLEERRRILNARALDDATANSFSVSYVGRMDLGCIEPFVESIYNYTDGSTYRSLFVEVASVGGAFHLAFLQGFSGDVYYRAFLDQLRACGLSFREGKCGPLTYPAIELPE